jgi:hypothetical protein
MDKYQLTERDICTKFIALAHKIGRLSKYQFSEDDEWVHAGGADEDSELRNVDHTSAPGAGKA